LGHAHRGPRCQPREPTPACFAEPTVSRVRYARGDTA
jgi:hypothetical protein